MHRAVGAVSLVLVSLVACAHVSQRSSRSVPNTAADTKQHAAGRETDSAQPAGEPEVPPNAATPDAAAAAGAASTATVVATKPAGTSAVTPSALKPAVPNAANAKAPRVNPVKISPNEGTTAKQAGSVKASEKPPVSALDLASLEQRLRDTHAIGVFTKLSLKNQVDDLLDEFRAFYGGRSNSSLTDLRQRYDLLLLKVLTLLQDSDPQLASAIAASREAIWSILADREKFQKI